MTMMLNIEELQPSDTPDYMVPAWLNCIEYSLGNDAIMAEYREQTGEQWTPGRTPLDRMIDEATGRDVQFLRDFITWFNVNVWGSL